MKELEALYNIATPKKKEAVRNIFGSIGEREAIKQYLKSLEYRDELSYYDFSRSARANPFSPSESKMDDLRKHYLGYDFFVVRDAVFEDDADTLCWKVEVKTKMFNANNYTYSIPIDRWKRYLEQAEEYPFLFLFVNLNSGLIRYADINHKLWRINQDCATINTFPLPHIGHEFAISGDKIREAKIKVGRLLGYKQQPIPGLYDEESF